MQYGYRVTFTDGTVKEGDANTRDVALWEINFSKHHEELESGGVFFYEFAWLTHASQRRLKETTLDLLDWLDTVDTIEPAEADPVLPLDLTASSGA